MSEKKTISGNQLKVLREMSLHTYEDGYTVLFFSFIAEKTGLPVRLVRLACRALKRKGFLFYGACTNSDYEIAGSGYSCTDEGAEFIKNL